MKKIILFLLLICLASNFCYSQEKNPIGSNQIKNEKADGIILLKKQISVLGHKLSVSDSVLKSIDDTRLRESIKSAENTISYQNSFIQIFEVIFGLIAILAGSLYFFSIRPQTKRAEKALDRANNATEKLENQIKGFSAQVDEKINIRFNLHEKELEEKRIKEIFADIESNLPNQRKLQIERLTSLCQTLDPDKIDRLFKVLDNAEISEYEKSTIIEVLIQINNYQIQKYFAIWKNVKKEETKIIDILYSYYMNNGIENFVIPISSFILNRIEPHIEFNRLLDMLPSHPDSIYMLINNKTLIAPLGTHSRKSVIDHIVEGLNSWGLVDKNKIETSFLFQKD